MIEGDRRKQEGNDLKLPMREVVASQMIEWKRTPNEEAWIVEAKRNQSDRDLRLQMKRAEPGQKKKTETMIEGDRRKQEGNDLKLPMRKVVAGQLIEWKRTPNEEAWIVKAKRNQSDRDLRLQMKRAETSQKKETSQMTGPGQKKKTETMIRKDLTPEVPKEL